MLFRRTFAITDEDALQVLVRHVMTPRGLGVVFQEGAILQRGLLRRHFAQVANLYAVELCMQGKRSALANVQFVHHAPAWSNGRFAVAESWHEVRMKRSFYGWYDPVFVAMTPDELALFSAEKLTAQLAE